MVIVSSKSLELLSTRRNNLLSSSSLLLLLVATLALLLAAIGGSDMSLQYIFVIHVGMHQSEVYELWIVRVVEVGSNIVYVAMTQVYSAATCRE